MRAAVLIAAAFGLAGCTTDGGIVLDVDADGTVADKAAVTRLVITIDGVTRWYVVSKPLPGSLAATVGAGAHDVSVEGNDGSVVLGRWSGAVVVSAGAVTRRTVILSCASEGCGNPVGDGGLDASPADGPGGGDGAGGSGGGGGGTDAPRDPPIDTLDAPLEATSTDAPPSDGLAGPPPSCAGLAVTCGPSSAEDCCASALVPGGTFDRGNDPMAPATVSAVRLDRFEVTVGRFRKFLGAGLGTKASPPATGSGANPHAPGTGWDAAWGGLLAADAEALKVALKCNAGTQTWTDAPGPNEDRPLNCVDWYTAFAFCIWDGGRLPTEAEWNFAAAGGGEQRVYPWSSPPSSSAITCAQAIYNPISSMCSTTHAVDVGTTSPAGDGKWGHSDMAGNVAEWTFDYKAPYTTPCIDCARTTPDSMVVARAVRGGSFEHDEYWVTTTARLTFGAAFHTELVGARCARDAP